MEISVVICTRNRAASLRETLRLLQRTDQTGIEAEVVVVDNAGDDDTRETVESCSIPRVRYLLEEKLGKGAALNRALQDGQLGDVVVVLDDDMSPSEDWLQGVWRSVRNNPDYDIFGGRVYPIYPVETLPDWAQTGYVRCWAFSVVDKGESDLPMACTEWPSGNNFWFRRRVLDSGIRFRNIWTTEPDFVLRLVEQGHKAMWSGSGMAGHRVQQHLFDIPNLRMRAAMLGRNLAHLRLENGHTQPEGRLRRSHPFFWAFRNGAALLSYAAVYALSYVSLGRDHRIGHQLNAIIGVSKAWEAFRI